MASENQNNVGFIGFVTRKDKDTGVNLLAKIVTPNKKRALNRLVRVKVKPNALDDYSCCVIDHATMKRIIEESQDLEAVSESFQFLYNGEHGTSITYAIEKLNEASSINQFLSEDGTLLGRPKYNVGGSADAVGYIRITVTKNDAEVSSRVMVRVKGMTADEVLNSDKIYSAYKNSLSEFLWDGIAIYDGSSNNIYANEGHTRITSPLLFDNMSNISVPDISEVPITCTWTVEYDEVADFIKNNSSKFSNVNLYTLPTNGSSRICVDKDSEDYGKIYQPTYKETCANLTNNRFATLMDANDNQAYNRRFRIGKFENTATTGRLCLRATLKLGEAEPIVRTYMCATTSKAMSTSEVSAFVKDIMKIKFNDTWVDCDSNPVTIYVPNMETDASSARPQTISVFGDGHYSNLSQEQYDQLKLSNITLSNVVNLRSDNDPGIYEVVNDNDSLTISSNPYKHSNKLFEPPSFVKENGTNSSGGTIADDMRTITIPVGTEANGNGMYAASNIINNSDASFGLRFRVTIQKLNAEDDETFLEFTKIFNLVRLE